MKIKTIVHIFFLLIIPGFFSSIGFSKGYDLLEQTETGIINWSKWTIEATGVGTLPEKRPENPSKVSLDAAKQDAHKKIIKALQQVRISNSTTVGKISDKSSGILEKIEALTKDAQIIKQEYLSDGTAKVTMEFNLTGAFTQLTLPQEIKQIESVKPISPTDSKPPVFTGLIVDATGIGARPALVPKIIDENNGEVFGSAFVSRESAVGQGVCGYYQDLSFARKHQRVGDHPLIVKGLRTDSGAESIIVISNTDAAKLKSASEHLQLLRKCRVLIVIDSPAK
ncbi:MAG: hypothetical protein V1714_05400 [Pseudomonadota bacterium]